jgi:hypothetical protein
MPSKDRRVINSYRARRREIVQKLKDVPCMDCGGKFEPCQMDFDHKGSKCFDVSIAVADGTSMEAILREIEKCDVVCSNCHRLRTRRRRKLKDALG